MTEQTQNPNIVLIGFMGSGKSSAARRLQTLLHMEVIEMDQLIAEREGMTIPEIFDKYGEEYFRDRETQLLIEMQERGNCIISCGGGVPLRERNVAEMKRNGTVFWLTAAPSTILARTKNDHDRPLLRNRRTEDGIRELMDARREKYQAAADVLIATDGKTISQVCAEIIASLS